MANVEKLVGTESPLEVGQKINEIIEKGVGGGNSLFDTKLSDHILEGEEAQGWALQGTYVYKDAVAGSREGYPDFYAKCLEEYQNSVNTKTHLKSNVNLVGSVVDNKGILSGFSTSSYASIDRNFPFNNSSSNIEIVFGFKLTSLGSVQTIWGCSAQYKGVLVYVNANNKLCIQASSNGSSWNIAANVEGTHVLTTDVFYKVKLVFDGTQYIVSYAVGDSDVYENDIVVTSSLAAYLGSYNIGAGISSNTDANKFLGTIDLNESYVNIGGERYWTGADNLEYKQNPNGHQFYDIANKEAVDMFFNISDTAWLYGIDTENERIFLPREIKRVLVDKKEPTEADPTWYNVYSDGWCEQGSIVTIARGATTHNLIKPYASTAYSLQITPATYQNHDDDIYVSSRTASTFTTQGSSSGASDGGMTFKVFWEACGYTEKPQTKKDYLYICVGNTETTSAVTDVVEVTTTENDTLPLLHHIPADELLEHPSWLRSAGQWNDGKVYTTAYEYLVNQYVNGTEHTDTLTASDGAEYTVPYKTINGKKVVDVANENQVSAVYAAIGSAWYYIIDQANIQFKLPQSHNSECYTADPTRVGLDVSAGLPNIIGDLGSQAFGTWNGAFYNTGLKRSDSAHPEQQNSGNYAAFDASLSNPIYGNSDTVTPPHTEFYLYFKVANAVQNLELLDVGAVTETLANKVDINSKVIGGQWVESKLQLSTATTKEQTIDLSDYLPKDGFQYEVLFNVCGYATSEYYGSLGTDLITTENTHIDRVLWSSSNSRHNCNTFMRPVGLGRYVKWIASNAFASLYISALGYRRIGTNR